MLTTEQQEIIIQLIKNDPKFRKFQKQHKIELSFSISEKWGSKVDLCLDKVSIEELVEELTYQYEQFLEHKFESVISRKLSDITIVQK